MKYICIMLVLLITLLNINVSAEETYTVNIGMYEALEFLNEEMLAITDAYELADAENERQMLMFCVQEMAFAQVGIPTSMTEDVLDAYGLNNISNVEEELILFRRYESEPTYIKEYDCLNAYNISSANGYFSLECVSNKTENNDLKKYVSIEVAHRIDTAEIMVLLKVYEESGVLSSTGRYLFHGKDGETEYLSTQTLGKAFDLSIDMYNWSVGEEYEWSVDLLFPNDLFS